ncbi:transaldolase family protein [Streptomyces sp. NPDC088116]|uniref:transaldolase family protein n=1 Tax=Streptomyces sp. NPDC088116 TaxID=3365825 RepID=UPI00382C69F1
MKDRTRPASVLAAEGVSLCLDALTRELLCPGQLRVLIGKIGVRGVSCRPAAVRDAVRDGEAYRAHLSDLAARQVSGQEAVRDLLYRDARTACDILLPLHRQSAGRYGYVGVPLDPYADGRRAVAEATAIRWAVDRPNVVVAVQAGAGAPSPVGDLLARGISVEVKSLFSPEQLDTLFEVFLVGLEQAWDAGCDLSEIRCAASFPLWVLDETIAARLGGPARRQGWAVAVARLAHHRREQLMDGARWRSLVRAGARPLHLVWSSHGASVREGVHYIRELVAWNSDSSADADVLRALGDAELRGDTVSGSEAASRRSLSPLSGQGVDLCALGAELRDAQLGAARAEWTELRRAVGAALDRAGRR